MRTNPFSRQPAIPPLRDTLEPRRLQFNAQFTFTQTQPAADQKRFEQEYEKLSTIGQGCFAKVYKCRSRIDHCTYAIKHSTAKFKKEIEYSNARQEGIALAKLFSMKSHKNIVKYYTGWIENNQAYLVMEYCDCNISNLSYRTEWELKSIIKDVLAALSEIHEQNLAHLDLKAENVLFMRREFCYKVADFGLSRARMIGEEDDLNEGDGRYMAPEIMEKHNSCISLDLSKADIFSLGCMMYELMRGVVMQKQGEEWLQIRQGVVDMTMLNYSNELKAIVRQMLQPNPNLRPSAKELLQCAYLHVALQNYVTFLRISNQLLKTGNAKKRKGSL